MRVGEVAGTVVLCGRNVLDFKKGDRVVGILGFGGYSTHIVCRPDQCFLVPTAIPFTVGVSRRRAVLTQFLILRTGIF